MSLADRLDEFTSRQGIVSAEWCKLLDEVEKLQEKNKTMREALEFYSTEDDWNFYCGCCADGSTKLEKDHGKLAREALAKVNNEN